MPRRFLSSSDKPSEPKSFARGSKRPRPNDSGTRNHFLNMYPPTLVVHKLDQCLRGSQIKYNTHEHAKMFLNQYGSNELEDLSCVTVGIDEFLPTLPIFEPDLNCSISLHPSS